MSVFTSDWDYSCCTHLTGVSTCREHSWQEERQEPLSSFSTQQGPAMASRKNNSGCTTSLLVLRSLGGHTGALLGASPNQNLLLLVPALPSALNLEQHPGVTPGHECWRSNLSYQRGKQGNNQVYWNCINKSMLSVQLNAHFFKTSYPKTCKGVLAVELKWSGFLWWMTWSPSSDAQVFWMLLQGYYQQLHETASTIATNSP